MSDCKWCNRPRIVVRLLGAKRDSLVCRVCDSIPGRPLTPVGGAQ